MPESHSEMHSAFVEAYPVYVAATLGSRGIEVDDVLADAIVEGTAVLDGLLTTLDRTEMRDQRVSPLELFREALRPVDHALQVVGVEPVANRGSVLAWDRYDLSPGSSQVLGIAAHQAHMQWAITKARAMGPLVTGPAAMIVASENAEPVLRERIEALGYRIAASDPSVVIIDADLAQGRDAVAAASLADPRPSRIVAYAAIPDDLTTMALKALGADMVVATDRLLAAPEEYLPALA